MEQVLQRVADGLMARSDVHHVLLAAQRGRDCEPVIVTRGDGGPGRPPLQPDTPFFIASISKLFIAITILRLHEAQRLDLDGSLADHLPWVDLSGLHLRGGVDRTADITLRHLLAHASGLPDYLEEAPRGGQAFIEEVVEQGDRDWDLAFVLERVRALRPHFPPQDLHAPRVRIRYSDTGYRLLIAVIEAVTGSGYETAVATEVLTPLGLERTWLSDPGHPLQARAASLYAGAAVLHIPLAMRAAGDFFSTAPDLLRLLAALMAGELFQKSATLEMMRDQRARFGPPRDRASLRQPGWPIEYGLGMMRFALPRLFTPLSPIPAVFGHTGSTGTWLFHCPERDLYLCGTVDQVTAGAVPFRVVPQLLRALG